MFYVATFDCVDCNKLWNILKEMGIPDHLTCLLRNLYEGQEATARTMIWSNRLVAPWERSTTPVFLPGESQGRGSLVSCRLWDHRESNTTEATEHDWSSTMTARLQPHVALAPTPGAPPLICSFVLHPEGLIRPRAATCDHRHGSAAQLLLLPIPLCPHPVLMISFTEWRQVPSKTFLFPKLVWKILYVGLLATMPHLINPYNPLLQRLERQTLSFPTCLVSNGSHRHSSGRWKARPHSGLRV